MSKLDFSIIKTKWNSRAWVITLNWVKLNTPVFMPVWTKATIKWIILDLLKNKDFLWTENPINLILANTFHLYLRPWDEIVKNAGWLNKFENRDKLILTDSWGFQVFSLWEGNKTKSLVKLQQDWVWFQSPIDGSKHFFSPEKVVDIQLNLGSDIMMVLDVCSSIENISKEKVAQQMQTTHSWAKKAFDYFGEKYDSTKSVLFPIVQWWIHKDLREESVSFLKQYAIDWIAIWWLSVWETNEEMYDILDFLSDKLPANKPRYLMWVGTIKDIREAVMHGIDMFDCVLPTRLGRHGTAFYKDWYVKLKNSQYKNDFSPLTDDCPCFVCKNYTKSYLSHLVRENEMLGWMLLSYHNIVYLHNYVEKLRKEILES